MKEIILKFREVAVDGLPDKSCVVVTLSGFDATGQGIVDSFYNIANVSFSKKYGKFNQHDEYEEDIESKYGDHVLFWCPRSELDAILTEEEPNA